MLRRIEPARAIRGGLRRWLLGLCATALVAPDPGSADDTRFRAALSYVGNRSSEGLSSDAFRQYYEITFQRALSEQLSLMLGVVYQDDRGTTTFIPVTGEGAGIETSTRLSDRYLKPYATFTWRFGDFTFTGMYDYMLDWYLDPFVGGIRRRDLWTSQTSLTWKPSRDLSLGLSGYSYSANDAAAALKNLNLRGSLFLDWRLWNRLRVQEDNRIIYLKNTQLTTLDESSRASYGPRLEVRYDDQFAQVVRMWLNYVFDLLQSQDMVRAGGTGTVLVEWLPVAALNGRTDVPTDTTSTPLTQNPALIDRDFRNSAGPSIGPSGSSFWNLAVDMGRVLDLDQFRVSVRDSNANVVPSGGLVTWTAYTSNDGQRWVEVPVTAQLFDPVQSNYRITFPTSTARFFKVVNFGTNTLDTLVTEIQVFSNEVVQGEQTRVTNSLIQNATGMVSVEAMKTLVLTWNGGVNLTRTWGEGLDSTNRDSFTTLTAAFGPYSDFRGTLTGTYRDSATAGFGNQSTLSAGAQAQYLPVRRFDISLSVGAFRDRVNQILSNTYSGTLASRLQLYDAFRMQFSATGSRQLVAETTTDYLGGGLIAELDLLRELRLIGRASLSQMVANQGGQPEIGSAPIPRPQQFQTYSLEGRYSPGLQLFASARAGYVETINGSGLAQNYRLSWSPFPDGAAQITTNFEQDIDPLTGRMFQRVTVWPRWQVNRYLALDLTYNYTRLQQTSLPGQNQQSVFATLSLYY